ncbi:AMP-binding protein [Pseudomonas azotoformans]|uniref:AMP-binding protein n=1 Tax=Pseudomonas azotoformans TaxID=47878 RepID=UPI00098F4A83|nr:AMP-binding protein [Pseudomonas azotoformans]AQT95155.1 CoF synthetase [Pseudomonas azotoformans]UMY47266.1 AMP-binding protein [Pseudomonas azotoformans]
MLVHNDHYYGVLQGAESEILRHGELIPDAPFYERKLRAVWERARKSEFYHALGDYSFAGFQALALTPKASLKGSPRAFCTVEYGQAAKYYATTGTTGEPTPSPRLKEDIIWNAVSVAFHWRHVIEPGSRVANLMPSDIVPVGDLIANVCEYLDVSHVRAYPFTTGITDWERLCKMFEVYRPTVIFIAPGVLVQLTRYLKQRQMLERVSESIKAIMLLGEVNTRPFREKLAQWWACDIHDASYGSTETGTLAAVTQGKVQRLTTGTNYFELVTASGQIVPLSKDASGRLVVTPLNLYARPLLRLDTGDSVTITSECAVGLPGPTMMVNGRDSDAVMVSGVDLEIRKIEEIVYGTSNATGYMIEVDRTTDSASLILERDVVWDNALEAGLADSLRECSQERMNLQWDRILFVNNLAAVSKSGASQKSWKKTNLRFVGGQQ